VPFLLTDDANKSILDELQQHVESLINPPTSPPPRRSLVQPTPTPTPLIIPPTSPAAPVTAPLVAPPPPPEPSPQAPQVIPQQPDPDVMQQLQQHVVDLQSGATQVVQGGVMQLGDVKDQLAQHISDASGGVINLAPPPTPSAAAPSPVAGAPQSDFEQDKPLDKNGVVAYVQQKARDFGLDPAAVLAVANQEGLNTDPGSNWTLPGEKNISFGPPSWYGNGAGADIIAKHGDDAARWSWTPEGIDYWLSQVQSAAKGLTGDEAVAAIVNKFERPREDLAAGEIAKAKQAYNQFVGGVQQGAQSAVQAGQQAVQGVQQKLSDISQFGDKQLTAAEAYAACGPAAAVRFAQLFGRNPTLREATDLASQVGWNVGQGMAGLGSESKLFDEMNIPHRTVGADWQALAREAGSGNPVVISTPGHYFTADAYDPNTGAFHVGRSGLDLKGGSEWMTPDQMEARMGRLQGGLAADNPTVPGGSPLSQGTVAAPSPVDQGLQIVRDAAGKARDTGLQVLDQAVSTAGDLATGGITRRFNENLQGLGSDVADTLTAGGTQTPLVTAGNWLEGAADAADRIAPGGGGLVPSNLMRAGANFLKTPGVLDSMQTLQSLTEKYGTPDSSQYNPEDQRAANQAMVAIGGVVSGGGGAEPAPGGTARMYHGTGADFPRVSPEAVSGEENLFGPGYYLTSDPRVAGGVVAKGGEQVGPSWLGSSVKRPGGEVVSPGYAQQRGPTDVIGLDDVDNIAQALEQVPSITPDLARQLAQGQRGASMLQGEEKLGQMLDALQVPKAQQRQILNTAFPAPAAGPNVRPVDVPQDLNLLDMDQPLQPDQAQSIAKQLGYPTNDPEVQSWTQPGVDGASVYDLVRGEVGGTKAAANKLLADAGLDGISYGGGSRIPMTDEGGAPIEHQATVIFPESLDRVTNATAGTPGGQIAAPFALGTGAAVGLGALAANRDRLNDALQGWQAPTTLDDLGRLKDQIGDRFSDLGGALAATGEREEAETPQWLKDRYKPLDLTQPLGPQVGFDPAGDVRQGLSDIAGGLGEHDIGKAAGGAYQTASGVLGGTLGPSGPETKAVASVWSNPAVRDFLQGESGALKLPSISRPSLAQVRAIGMNSMLSAPTSLFTNAMGITENLKRPAITLAEAPIRALTGDFQGASTAVKRAVSDAVGQGAAMGDALAEGASVFTTGARRGGGAATSPTGMAGIRDAFPGATGMVVTPHLRTLGATDAIVGHMADAGAQSAEIARLKVLNPGLSTSRIQSIFRSQITAAGEAARQEATYQSGASIGGDMISNLKRSLDSWGAPGSAQRVAGHGLSEVVSAFIPFSGIPGRFLARGLGRLPVANEVQTAIKVGRALRTGDADAAYREGAAGLLAAGVNTFIFSQAMAGNITGNGPDDTGEKQALMDARDANGDPTWQPNSIRIATPAGTKWVNYSSFPPVGIQMAGIANSVEAWNEANKKARVTGQDLDYGQLAQDVGKATGQTVADAWYFQQVARIASAMKDGTWPSTLGETLTDYGMRYVPEGSALNWARNMTDQTVRETRSKNLPQDLLQRAENRIPGLEQNVPPRIDPTTGQPMQAPKDWSSFFIRSSARGDPNLAASMLAEHGMGLAQAPDTITQGKQTVKLTPDEQQRFLEFSGPDVQARLSALARNSEYQAAKPEEQKKMIQRAMGFARTTGENRLWASIPSADRTQRADLQRRLQSANAQSVYTPPSNSSSSSTALSATAPGMEMSTP